MRRRCLLALLLLGSLAAPARADAFRFAWPVPGKVTVTERVQKKGTAATIRYDVILAPKEKGRIALQLTNFQLLDLGGQPLPAKGPVRKQIEEAVKAASALPTMFLSKDGELEEIGDLRPVIAAAVAASKTSGKERQQLTKLMQSPQVKAAMQQRAAEFWNLWVGMWAGGELEPERPRQLTLDTPLPNGSVLQQPLTIVHNGIAGPPGHVRVSYETRLEGPANRQMLKAMVDGMLREAGAAAGQPVPAELIEDIAMVGSGDLITDPSTLRPAYARSQRRLIVTMKGQPPQTLLEAHEYTFDWTAPPDRGKKP